MVVQTNNVDSQTQCDMTIVSFGRIGRQPPPQPHFVIDVSQWRDPLGSKELRTLYKDGRAGEVQDFVAEDPKMSAAINSAEIIAYTTLIGSQGATKPWLSIGIRDHHGIWTAPAVAEILAEDINRKLGLKVFVRHAELSGMSYFTLIPKDPTEIYRKLHRVEGEKT